mmetsp:Transcript_25834/g.59077  ORF Transcript_25834/g.59077 Transcript_25834/m.59077 type:complete len:123 (+) Transcript_25834:237-605(+)
MGSITQPSNSGCWRQCNAWKAKMSRHSLLAAPVMVILIMDLSATARTNRASHVAFHNSKGIACASCVPAAKDLVAYEHSTRMTYVRVLVLLVMCISAHVAVCFAPFFIVCARRDIENNNFLV